MIVDPVNEKQNDPQSQEPPTLRYLSTVNVSTSQNSRRLRIHSNHVRKEYQDNPHSCSTKGRNYSSNMPRKIFSTIEFEIRRNGQGTRVTLKLTLISKGRL